MGAMLARAKELAPGALTRSLSHFLWGPTTLGRISWDLVEVGDLVNPELQDKHAWKLVSSTDVSHFAAGGVS